MATPFPGSSSTYFVAMILSGATWRSTHWSSALSTSCAASICVGLAPILLGDGSHHALVVVDGVERRDRPVLPTVIHDDLSAASLQASEVRVGRVEDAGQLVIGDVDVAVEVEGPEVPARILEDHVGEKLVPEKELQRPAWRCAGDPDRPVARRGDGARRIAGEDLLSCARVPWPVHDLHERGHLWRREARVGVGPLTQELRWIEVASPRVVDDAVHDAVERVTGGERRGLDGGELARRDVAAWSTHRRLLVPNEPHEVVRPEVGRCPDDDAIVVVGEALRFHERLPAAVRASAEVGTPGTVAVEGADDRLGPLGRFVDRAIPEIDDPFRVSHGPAGVAGRVGILRPGGRVAAAAPGGPGGMTAAGRPTTRTRTPKWRLIGSPPCATDRGPGLAPLSGVSLARLREDPPSREGREPAGSCGRR